MKKLKLPKNWVVVNSKSHPDRVYYFNVKTNESSWKEPTSDGASKPSASDAQKSKKRKKCDEADSVNTRATTPDLEEGDNTNCNGRRTLLAKRHSKPVEERDTPAMAEIRKKMLQRQSKSGSSKNSSPSSSSVTTQLDKSKKDTKPEIMTPQMRVIYEKLQQKNIKKNVSKQLESSTDTTETDTSINTRKRSRNRNRRRRSCVSNDSKEDDVRSHLNESKIETRSSGREDVGKGIPESKDDSLYKLEKETEDKECKNNVIKKGGSAIVKKNMAKERLDKLRKMLNLQIKDQKANNKVLQNCDQSLLGMMTNKEPLNIYKTADTRHKNLRNRLLRNKGILQTDEMLSVAKSNTQTQSLDSLQDLTHESNDTAFCEEMDWEPMEDEKITFEVQAARTQLCIENIAHHTLPVAENILRISSSFIQEEKKVLYIVVDTNVFLSKIEAIERARDIQFGTYNRPILVIPWTVLRELDYLKDDKSRTRSERLRAKARKAINFLHEHFSSKHPRVVGQTPEDVAKNKERFATECPDDEILQTCLQIRDAGRTVALLSYDKNLCNKAMIYDIIALGKDDPLEKIDYLASGDNTNLSFHDIYFQETQGRESENMSTLQKELHCSDELFEDVQSTVQECLSVIVTKEMKNLYGETWEKYTIIKPPWTILYVLKCAIKHWIAAVSEAFDRRAESVLKELQEIFNKMPKNGRRLKDIAYLLEKCSDLMQMIKVDKYPDLMARASSAVDELKKKCQNYMNEIREKKLEDEIGREDNIIERKHRAEKAFKYFDNIYAYARDIGGMAANIVGMPCSFCYQVPNPTPSVEYVKKIQSEVAENVYRLLRVLTTAVEQMQNSSLDHRALIDLYHTLTAFLPERLSMVICDLSPLDVYCCLKEKEDVLKTGIQQLQELSTHFCRLASYRCI
ncbi:hypothetical protein KPH14_007955 [Odynerus spinipes]|uniref:WW domain-containing protein n=1 Tax=Odynerus spinipes TaxID=1348599 RepID=A0AAD9VND3_9HYME|nr:hypothetical protein KPH14_007955 [Odynerus spinipes]